MKHTSSLTRMSQAVRVGRGLLAATALLCTAHTAMAQSAGSGITSGSESGFDWSYGVGA